MWNNNTSYTFKQRWFLVQINNEDTTILSIKIKSIGDYHVTFLTRDPDDNIFCDDQARWWIERDDNNVPVYGSHMLCSPKWKPNLKKYMLWSDSVHLNDTKNFIHDPFNYNVHEDIIQSKQYVALTHWKFLFSFCNQFSTVSPTLSTLTVRKSSQKKGKK